MLVYRIASSKFAEDLSGESARLFGGRWNQVGVPVLYTYGNIALSAFTIFVHSSPAIDIGKMSYRLVTIEIPDSSVEELNLDIYSYQLISDQNYRYDAVNDWIERQDYLCLKVPSEIVEGEFNILINTRHPLAKSQVKLKDNRSFVFDKRLFNKTY